MRFVKGSHQYYPHCTGAQRVDNPQGEQGWRKTVLLSTWEESYSGLDGRRTEGYHTDALLFLMDFGSCCMFVRLPGCMSSWLYVVLANISLGSNRLICSPAVHFDMTHVPSLHSFRALLVVIWNPEVQQMRGVLSYTNTCSFFTGTSTCDVSSPN